MKKFKSGEIVQLKSGGPKMTVSKSDAIGINDEVYCKWFSGSKLADGWFGTEMLEKVDSEDEKSNERK